MTKFIAIDGDGGSGKTYLSKILAKKLDVPLYHLDDYGNDYQPFVGIPAMIEEIKNIEDKVAIIEGIGVFDGRFDFLNPFRIYVNTPNEVRSRRAMERDKPNSERTAEEWRKIYKIWEVEASDYIANASKRADIIVDDSGEWVANHILEKTKNFLKHVH